MKQMKCRLKGSVVSMILFMAVIIGSFSTVGAETSTQRAVNPKVESNDTTWDCVWFGCYPQTEVTGEALTSDILGATYNEQGDAVVDGAKYRRMKKRESTLELESEYEQYYDSFDWTTGGDANGYHYFKYEPIKWRVLSVDGDNAFIISDKILDSSIMGQWPYSRLRKWLNGLESEQGGGGYVDCGFIDYAFTENEKNSIYTTHVTDYTDNGYYTITRESDEKIYIPSYSEMLTEVYGFSGDNKADLSRIALATDYSKALGLFSLKDEPKGTNYWTRTDGIFTDTYESFTTNGADNPYRNGRYEQGVRPVLHLNLASIGTWLYAGTISKNGIVNEIKPYEVKEIKVEKTKTVYKTQEILDLSDITVTAIYSDGHKKTVTNYTNNSNMVDMKTPGNKKLTIYYEEDGVKVSADIAIEVIVKNGDIVKTGVYSYKLTNTNKGKECVTVQKIGKKATSIKIPDKITIQGISYNVTGIAVNAFSNNKKLKKVTIGKNVTVIGKNAFKNCSNLKTVVIKTKKLTNKSVGQKAFKGTNKKLTFKVPSKQYSKYKRFLLKKGNKKATVKKS